MSGLDSSFEYVRIYSIHRTSLDGQPVVKRVADMPLKDDQNLEGKALVYVDNGTTGDAVDPSELLFKGSEVITASTMAQKDNTLFLGDIKLLRNAVPANIKESLKTAYVGFRNNLAEKRLSNIDSGGVYPYVNQLNENSSRIRGFKYLDWYRLGIQFQHKTGRWSEAVFVKDLKNDKPVSVSSSLNDVILTSAIL